MSKNRIYRVACSVLLCILMLGSILVPSSSDKRSSAASSSLLSTYGSLFGRSGNCVSLSQLQNSSTLAHIKSQYNSITLENEMKPDILDYKGLRKESWILCIRFLYRILCAKNQF